MKNLTSLLRSIRRLRNWLALALWLGSSASIQASANVNITSYTPDAVAPDWASVTVNLEISGIVEADFGANDIAPFLRISCTGGDIDGGDVISSAFMNANWYTFTFFVRNISGPLTITATTPDDTSCATILYAQIDSIEARMAQDDAAPLIDAANFDQDVYFKAVLSEDPLPGSLTTDLLSWSPGAVEKLTTVWAKLSDPTPGHPTISAYFGCLPANKDVWKVKVTVVEVTLKADSGNFADLGIDPPDQCGPTVTYRAPHWRGADFDTDTGLCRHPVQYHAGTKFKANAKFNVEPTDFTSSTTLKADGSDSVGEKNGDPASGILTISDFLSDANLPPTSGIATINPAWKFKVGESSFGDAGTTDHEIYRTLAAPIVRPRTVAYIACNNTPVDDEDLDQAFEDIWTYFAGRAVTRWNGDPLYYFGAADFGQNVPDLLEKRHGDCIAWTAFFQWVQYVHGNSAATVTMTPKAIYQFPGVPGFKTLVTNTMYFQDRAGQGGTASPGPFINHKGSRFAGQIYDPSFGLGPFPTKLDWDDAMLYQVTYGTHLGGNNYVAGSLEELYGAEGREDVNID